MTNEYDNNFIGDMKKVTFNKGGHLLCGTLELKKTIDLTTQAVEKDGLQPVAEENDNHRVPIGIHEKDPQYIYTETKAGNPIKFPVTHSLYVSSYGENIVKDTETKMTLEEDIKI